MIPVVVERQFPAASVSGAQLVKDLPQRPHPGQQITKHRVHVLRMLDGPGGVRKPAQRLGCFPGVGAGIVERRHDSLPHRRVGGRCAGRPDKSTLEV